MADNCDDDTAAVAAARGARVLTRTDPTRRGKGRALAFAFDALLAEARHDAFVLLDADTRPAPDFLSRIDAALRRGARVVQAQCAVANADDSWRTALMTADLALVYHLRPAGRNALGASAEVQGPVAITPGVLREIPWETTSVAEDREYHLRLVLHGLRSIFVPEAVVYTLMEPTMAAARQQELRWEGGRLGLARRYLGPLLRAAWRRGTPAGRWTYLDTALDLTVPPFSLLAAGTAAMTALHALAFALGRGPGVLAALWAVLLAAQTVYVFAGCALARVPRRAYAALFVYGPLFAVAKVGCFVVLARGGTRGWVPTARRPPRPAGRPDGGRLRSRRGRRPGRRGGPAARCRRLPDRGARRSGGLPAAPSEGRAGRRRAGHVRRQGRPDGCGRLRGTREPAGVAGSGVRGPGGGARFHPARDAGHLHGDRRLRRPFAGVRDRRGRLRGPLPRRPARLRLPAVRRRSRDGSPWARPACHLKDAREWVAGRTAT